MLSSRSSPVSTPLEACRVAPYVSLPSSLRVTAAAVQALNTPTVVSSNHHHASPSSHFTSRTGFPGFDPALLTVAAHQYAAAMSSAAVSVRSVPTTVPVSSTNPLFHHHHPLNLAALAVAHSKNSSIADLRLKAKKHAEAIFGGERVGGGY